MKSKVILDISLINEKSFDEIKDHSILHVSASDPISQNIFYDKVTQIVKDIDTFSKPGIILLSKLNEIISDFNRLYLILRQLDYFEKNNLLPLYNKKYYPHMSYILNDTQNIHPYWIRSDVQMLTKLKIYMRNTINKLLILKNKKNIIHGYMTNPLLLSYIEKNNKFFLDHRLHEQSWGKSNNKSSEVEDLIETLRKNYRNILYEYEFNKKYFIKACNILDASINYHMRKANHDYNMLPNIMNKKFMGDTFISGTPKYLGRLVSAYYQKMSKSTWRFAHGGDRAFFDDYNFSITEFPYCDKYFCHSHLEANNIKQRLKEGRMINLNFNAIEFTANSNVRSRSIYKNSKKSDSNKKRYIFYYCGTYVGERLARPMNERCPDIQYIEWQSWLISALRKLNYNIIIKRHPKGILTNNRFLEKYSNEVIRDNYKNQLLPSCYLFDFFGTAMFDAMATKTGIIYFDMGLRTMDMNSKHDFNSRCVVLDCIADNNRFRVNEKALSDALEKAINYNYEEESKFYKNYIN